MKEGTHISYSASPGGGALVFNPPEGPVRVYTCIGPESRARLWRAVTRALRQGTLEPLSPTLLDPGWMTTVRSKEVEP